MALMIAVSASSNDVPATTTTAVTPREQVFRRALKKLLLLF